MAPNPFLIHKLGQECSEKEVKIKKKKSEYSGNVVPGKDSGLEQGDVAAKFATNLLRELGEVI